MNVPAERGGYRRCRRYGAAHNRNVVVWATASPGDREVLGTVNGVAEAALVGPAPSCSPRSVAVLRKSVFRKAKYPDR